MLNTLKRSLRFKRRDSKKEEEDASSQQQQQHQANIFGRELHSEDGSPTECEGVDVVRELIEWLETHEGELEEGIFRIPGVQFEVEAIRQAYDTHDHNNNNNNNNTAVGSPARRKKRKMEKNLALEGITSASSVASVLKLYFRCLPQPVIIFRYYDAIIRAHKDNESETARLYSIKCIIDKLPAAHQTVLLLLIQFLHKVISHSDVNQMTALSLSICWAPNLIRSPNETLENSMFNSEHITGVVQTLIQHAAYFVENVVVVQPQQQEQQQQAKQAKQQQQSQQQQEEEEEEEEFSDREDSFFSFQDELEFRGGGSVRLRHTQTTNDKSAPLIDG